MTSALVLSVVYLCCERLLLNKLRLRFISSRTGDLAPVAIFTLGLVLPTLSDYNTTGWWSPPQACKVLLDAGALLDTKASSGGTALMFAAAAGYTDVVALLLERGAHVNDTVQVTF